MQKLAPTLTPPMKTAEYPSVDAAYTALATGRADAAASDDILLTGAAAAHPSNPRLPIVGDYLSYEPYAIMFRRNDPDLATLVTASFTRMAESGLLRSGYERWFTNKLPTGPSLAPPHEPPRHRDVSQPRPTRLNRHSAPYEFGMSPAY